MPDTFLRSATKAGEVFGEVVSLRLVGQEIAELPKRLLHDLGIADDTSHDRLLAPWIVPSDSVQASRRSATGI
jgi:hypothetical protein